jgi:hypothetical protein
LTPTHRRDDTHRVQQTASQGVDDYLRDLDALAAAHDRIAEDRVVPAIGAGRASRDVVRRVLLEHYAVGKWITAELPLLVANAPDAYCFTMEDSTHYRHWAQRFAGDAGYLSGPSHVQAAIEWCRQIGLTDEDIRTYTPLPETIAATCTLLFYMRRSYEEGLAVLGWAGDRVTARGPQARTMVEGLERHYGVTGDGAKPADDDNGTHPRDLFRAVATTQAVQVRCREAIRNVLLTAACRARAMNRWVE